MLSSSLFGKLPFCDPENGVCHEEPDEPSPRTIYSAWSKEQYDEWWEVHTALNESAAKYASSIHAVNNDDNDALQQNRNSSSSSISIPLILLGDSITEAWVGTSYGKPRPRTQGIPEVLQRMTSTSILVKAENEGGEEQDDDNDKGRERITSLSQKISLNPLVLAISGDQTQHLLYRLMNGELQHEEYTNDRRAIFVVMIGTNNLGSGMTPDATARGIYAVAKFVLDHTKGRLLLFDLLPRGDGQETLPNLCPPRCNRFGKPFRSFLPAIDKVNDEIQQTILPSLRQSYGNDRIHPISNCGDQFLDNHVNASEEVDITLMPDRLHPNPEGHELLAQCILETIQKVVII